MNQTSLPVEDAYAWRERQVSSVFLDIRTHNEYGSYGIEGAMVVPIEQLQSELHKLSLPKDRPVVCICANGRKSALAAEFLRQQGYQAMNMEGGMADWLKFEHAAGIISDDEYEKIGELLNASPE